MYDVFISYSTKDSNVADAVCHIFEENGVRCWYAGRRSGPADLTPGFSYSSEIVKGIKNAKVVVLILSEAACNSHNVLNEIETATSNKKIVIPFKIEETELSDEMYYYVKRLHWLEALSEPREEKIKQLLNKVQHVLGLPEDVTLKDSNDSLSKEIRREAKEIEKFLEDGKVNQAKEHTVLFLTEVFNSIKESNTKGEMTVEQMESILNSKNHFNSPKAKRVGLALYELLSFVKKEEEEPADKVNQYQKYIKTVSGWIERKNELAGSSDSTSRSGGYSTKETTSVNVTKINNTINGDVNAPFSVTGNVNTKGNS